MYPKCVLNVSKCSQMSLNIFLNAFKIHLETFRTHLDTFRTHLGTFRIHTKLCQKNFFPHQMHQKPFIFFNSMHQNTLKKSSFGFKINIKNFYPTIVKKSPRQLLLLLLLLLPLLLPLLLVVVLVPNISKRLCTNVPKCFQMSPNVFLKAFRIHLDTFRTHLGTFRTHLGTFRTYLVGNTKCILSVPKCASNVS